MVDTELLEKFYSKIFTTPKKRITVSLGIITILLASILNGVNKSFFAKRYIFIGLALIVLLLLVSRYINLAFNSRRTFFLALLILIFIEIFDFLVIHFGYFELIILSPAALSTLITIVLYFTSQADLKKVIMAVLFLLLLLYPVDYAFSFSAPHRMLSYTIATVFGIFLASIYIKYLDKEFKGINIKDMLKSFIIFWLTTNPEKFEEKLREYGINYRGFIKCIEFKCKKNFKLINTTFHPGPMRNVGGAKLVGRILNNENTVYLHSATKHELNPTSEKDVEKIVNSIVCCKKTCIAEKPFKIEGNYYTLYCFPFNCVTLIILSGKNFTDDLPPKLNEYAEKLFGEVIVCEAHNAHKERSVDEKEIKEAMDLIKKASEIKVNEKVELKCSFSEKRIETEDICGYVRAVILDYGDKKYCLLMIDGNNMLLDFRRELERIAKEKGFELIAITTDNHSKTGISPKIGYKPVGSDKRDFEVLKFLKNFLKKDVENVLNITYGKNEVEVKVMGKRFFEGIEKGFKEIGEKALYLFWALIFIEMVVSILLGIYVIV